MNIIFKAAQEAVRNRGLLKAQAKNKAEKFCKKLDLTYNTDTFENKAAEIKNSSGEYTKNPLKKLVRFVKEFIKLFKKELAQKRSSRREQRRISREEWMNQTAENAPNPPKRPTMADFAEGAK